MNVFLEAEITNMISLVKTFEKTCYINAKKDDNIISKEEEKQLKMIQKASSEFIKKLSKIS